VERRLTHENIHKSKLHAPSATRHRRLLDNIGYSTTSVTQHHQLLNIINHVNKRN
jgi:hypothetical protein